MKVLSLGFPLVLLSLTLAAPIHAAWPTQGVLVKTAQPGQVQERPQIVSDGHGGAILVWSQFSPSDPPRGFDIYAQRVDSTGTVQWSADGVALCVELRDQRVASLVSDGAGGAIVTWEDNRIQGPFKRDIYAQRINAAGVPQWAANGVAVCTANQFPISNQIAPRLTSDGAGGAIITWTDYRSTPPGQNITGYADIYAQRISSSGTVQWTTDGIAVTVAAGDQSAAGIAVDGSGGAIITWGDGPAGDQNIKAGRVDASGHALWAVSICQAVGHQFSPAIESDSAGGAIVTWSDRRSGNTAVYAQRINELGVVQWMTDGVVLCTTGANSVLAPDGTGGAIVAWTSGDIFAQRVNAAGVVQWADNGVRLCNDPPQSFGVVIASDGVGGAIVAWHDLSSESDIHAQHVNEFGALLWGTNPPPVCNAASRQDNTCITSDSFGEPIVMWIDARSARPDIYAQKLFDLDIQFIDPHRYLSAPQADLTLNAPDVWATSTDLCEGVAADSLTHIVVRIPAADVSGCDLRIEDSEDLSGDIGLLSSLDGGPSGTSIQLAPVTVNNSNYFFALYQAPSDFVRFEHETEDLAKTERRVVVTVDLAFPIGGISTITDTLIVRRPPVALLHGIWSSAERAYPREVRDLIEAGGKRTAVALSYQPTNHSHFDVNKIRPLYAIRTALAVEREKYDVAATRADVVAHSMGGLLTRLYTQDNGLYRRPENYNEGDVYRLLTINTPHMGTPVASKVWSFLIEHPHTYQEEQKILDIAIGLWAGKDVATESALRGGAVEDLQWSSNALLELGPFARPCHALMGESHELAVPDVPDWVPEESTIEVVLWFLLPKLAGLVSSSIFCNEPHDWVVPLRSQQGGKQWGYTLMSETSHTQAVARGAEDHIDALLDLQTFRSAWDNPFVGNTPSAYCPPTSTTVLSEQIVKGEVASWPATVEIVQPVGGVEVAPGQTLTIEVSVQGAPPGARVVLLGNLVAVMDTPPFVTTWTIPANAIGRLGLLAFSVDDSQVFGFSNVTELVVDVHEPPTALAFLPASIELAGPNDVFPASLVGTWANGVERDVTSSRVGTTYESSDESVVRISADGALIGKGLGVAIVTGHFKAATASATVEVLGDAPVVSPDRFAPEITFGAFPDTLIEGSAAWIDVTVVDDLSGVEYQSVPNGPHALDTATYGMHSFSVVARDYVGNESTKQYDYFVISPVPSVAHLSGLVTADCPSPDTPLDDVTIEVYEAGDLVTSSVTNASGAYSIELDAGDYTVAVVTPPGYHAPVEEVPASVSAGQTTTVDFELSCVQIDITSGTFWVGLKNSDDQGTQFDLRAEVYVNDTLVSDGVTRCITGLTRNANKAKEVAVPFGAIADDLLEPGDVVSLKVLTRIGTNPDDTKCSGHSSAVGLRLYYDAVSRPSRVAAEITPDPLTDFFLHSDGTDYLDDTAPTGGTTEFKDSPSLNFAGGNAWKEIGTWSMTIPVAIDGMATTPPAQRPDAPEGLVVTSVRPNPFNPQTTISYAVPTAGYVSLTIYDVSGRVIRALVAQEQAAGEYAVTWHGEDDRGESVASGIYFARLASRGRVDVRKLVLLK